MKKISKSLIEKKLKAGEVDFFTEDVIRLIADDEAVMRRVFNLRADFHSTPKISINFYREIAHNQWFEDIVAAEIRFNSAWNHGTYLDHLRLFYEFYEKIAAAAGRNGINTDVDFKQYFEHKEEYIKRAKLFGYWN